MSIEYFLTYTEAESSANSLNGKISRVLHGDKRWEVRSGSDVIDDLRPTVTKWQFIQACADAGITEAQIKTAVLLLNAKRQRFWEHTNILDRDNPFSMGLRSNLTPVPTPAQWSAIFIAASQLDPLLV